MFHYYWWRHTERFWANEVRILSLVINRDLLHSWILTSILIWTCGRGDKIKLKIKFRRYCWGFIKEINQNYLNEMMKLYGFDVKCVTWPHVNEEESVYREEKRIILVVLRNLVQFLIIKSSLMSSTSTSENLPKRG